MHRRELKSELRDGRSPFVVSPDHNELEMHWRKPGSTEDLHIGIKTWVRTQLRQYMRLRRKYSLPKLNLGDDSSDWSIYHFETPTGAYVDVYPVIHRMESIVLPQVALETLRWRVRAYDPSEGAAEGADQEICDAPTLLEVVPAAIAVMYVTDQIQWELRNDARALAEQEAAALLDLTK